MALPSESPSALAVLATLKPTPAENTPSANETLQTLAAALTAACDHITAPEFPPSTPPKNGNSLLNVKNELMLSYLHLLTTLFLSKLHNVALKDDGASDVIKSMVRLRVLYEKGVKHLENKFKYQFDKVISAAADSEAQQKSAAVTATNGSKKLSKKHKNSGSGTDTDTDSDSNVESPSAASAAAPAHKEYTFRPNPSALSLPRTTTSSSNTSSKPTDLYRPPRISATSMPTPATTSSSRRERPQKSTTLDEFVATELSTAPLAEPSIGSTIFDSGRTIKTDRDRKTEAERQEYEESNFVRLPKMSKKEAAAHKRRIAGNGGGEGAFGGEDWNSFAGDVERIAGSFGGGKKGGSGSRALENSRKRKADERGGGGKMRIGGEYAKSVNLEKRRSKKRKS